MKKLIIISIIAVLALSASMAFGANYSYPYVYKSNRALGMGGAYVAIGGKVDTLFYNPAGLSRMPQKNWEFNIIGLDAEISSSIIDFALDTMDALEETDAEKQQTSISELIKKNIGENMHLRLSNTVLSVGRNGEKTAFGFGIFDDINLDARPHMGFGSEGMLTVRADATGGGIFGISRKVKDNIAAGASVKYFYKSQAYHDLTARELAEKADTLLDFITEDVLATGYALGIDLGGTYSFAQSSWYRPTAGLSVLNLGGLNFKDAGEIPMTVNLGISANPTVPVFNNLILGLDYVDLLNAYEQDSDIAKRVRLGGELQVFDKTLMGLAVRAGLYQGYPTFGADLRFTLIDLAYTTYAEELGAYAGQDGDRRHMVSLKIGW